MSRPLGPYDRVRVLTDKYESDGAATGSIGYIIEAYPDGGLEIEISDPTTGETLAQVVARPEELELAEIGADGSI